MSSRIMYMEYKGSDNTGEARIGRVSISSFNHTVHYGDKIYQPHTDRSNKANYYEVGSGAWFWISPCQKQGLDSIEPRKVIIDNDVQEEYWKTIRRAPDQVGTLTYQSPGKQTTR